MWRTIVFCLGEKRSRNLSNIPLASEAILPFKFDVGLFKSFNKVGWKILTYKNKMPPRNVINPEAAFEPVFAGKPLCILDSALKESLSLERTRERTVGDSVSNLIFSNRFWFALR